MFFNLLRQVFCNPAGMLRTLMIELGQLIERGIEVHHYINAAE